jgi:hypothetical protein
VKQYTVTLANLITRLILQRHLLSNDFAND